MRKRNRTSPQTKIGRNVIVYTSLFKWLEPICLWANREPLSLLKLNNWIFNVYRLENVDYIQV